MNIAKILVGADKIHKKAQRYASLRNEEAKKIRREKKLTPVDPDPNREIYLAHYEGFKAGWRAGKKDRREEDPPAIRLGPSQDEFKEQSVHEAIIDKLNRAMRAEPGIED